MEVSLQISIPAKQEYYSSETLKAWTSLKKELDSHNKKVGSHNTARAKIAGSNPESISAEDLYDGHASARFRFALVRNAIELSDKVSEFVKLHWSDKDAELQKTRDELKAKRKQIRDQMTDIGFEPSKLLQGHEHGVNQISMSHPDVIILRNKESSLSGSVPSFGGDRKALIACLERMTAAVLKA